MPSLVPRLMLTRSSEASLSLELEELVFILTYRRRERMCQSLDCLILVVANKVSNKITDLRGFLTGRPSPAQWLFRVEICRESRQGVE